MAGAHFGLARNRSPSNQFLWASYIPAALYHGCCFRRSVISWGGANWVRGLFTGAVSLWLGHVVTVSGGVIAYGGRVVYGSMFGGLV